MLDDGASKAQEATRDYVLTLEHPAHIATKVVNTLCPDWLLNLGRPVVPTFVFLLRHPASCSEFARSSNRQAQAP